MDLCLYLREGNPRAKGCESCTASALEDTTGLFFRGAESPAGKLPNRQEDPLTTLGRWRGRQLSSPKEGRMGTDSV